MTLFGFSLDYPGIGPEHAFFHETGRAEYYSATDKDALTAFEVVSKLEGIIPALETSHAFAHLEVGLFDKLQYMGCRKVALLLF